MRRIVLISLIFIQFSLASCIEGKRLSSVLNPGHLYDKDAGTSEIKAFRGDTAFPTTASWAYLRADSATNYTDTGKAQAYLQAGIFLSDQLCSDWFRKLGQAQAQVNADRDIISNIGALTAVIMGITQAPAVAVGAAAGASGFLENMFKTEEANYIVAPSVAKVQAAIDLQRSVLAAELWNDETLNYYQAEVALRRYDNTCSHLSLKRIVDESISRTADLIQSSEKRKSALGQLLVTTELQNIESLFPQSKPLSMSDAFSLYALMFRADLTKDLSDSLLAQLKERKILSSAGELTLSDDNQKKLHFYLRRMSQDSFFDKELNKLIDARKRPAPGAPEAPAPGAPEAPAPGAPGTPTPGG